MWKAECRPPEQAEQVRRGHDFMAMSSVRSNLSAS